MANEREDGSTDTDAEDSTESTPPSSKEASGEGSSDEVAPQPLHETLLSGPPAASDRRPESRWAYPLIGILFATLFVAYQASVLLVWNTPGKGLAKTFHKEYLDKVHGQDYFKTTRLSQSWAMFAPNPNRTNTFVRVFVEDDNGDLWDYRQDIWGVDRYPYLWYDRGGKINRRINGKKHYQRIYGAWVCRDWEREHEGAPAKSVTFIRRYSKVPHWNEVIKRGGWDPWKAPFKQKEQETITCKTTVHAQLPPRLHERYGFELPEEDDKRFRPVRQRTWWDKVEAERKKAEREAKQAEKRQEWETKRDERRSEAKKPKKRAEPRGLDARGPVKEAKLGGGAEDDGTIVDR